ncbi:hypothetical protein HC766_09400 [Candidatus Gracilibacteria bacterium]|nr:hypothetical protein [Candidatus Gracilibacteria bacterium]
MLSKVYRTSYIIKWGDRAQLDRILGVLGIFLTADEYRGGTQMNADVGWVMLVSIAWNY